MSAMCYMCAKPERYGPPRPLEGSERLFHFQGSDNWNAGQCFAQPILSIPVATTTRDATGRWATVKSTCGFCGNQVEHVCTAFLKEAPPADAAKGGPPCNHERETGKKVIGCLDCYPPCPVTDGAGARSLARRILDYLDTTRPHITSPEWNNINVTATGKMVIEDGVATIIASALPP